MELWDVLDENRVPTGRLAVRGEGLNPGEYHLVCDIWVMNSRGEYLLSKRSPNKHFPLMWEPTGGSAVAGEDSYTTAIRETEEEIGLNLEGCEGHCLFSLRRDKRAVPSFKDVWLFFAEADTMELKLQEEEVCEARWVSEATLREMISQGEVMDLSLYLEEFIEKSKFLLTLRPKLD